MCQHCNFQNKRSNKVEHLFVQAVHEIVKDAPYVTQCSGGIKALAPEDLLPHMIGEFVR